jgi:hypothetical protein
MHTATSNGPVTPGAKDLPLLRREAEVIPGDRKVAIRHHRDEVTLEGAAAQLFLRAGRFLDGKTPLASAAAELGEAPAQLEKLLGELEKAGVLAFQSGQGDQAPMSGLDLPGAPRVLQFLARGRYRHPFWEKVVTGKATRSQVVGFAFEKYHHRGG